MTGDEGRELTAKADAAFRAAAADVLRRARETGTPIIVWKDGRVQALPPEAFDEGGDASPLRRNTPEELAREAPSPDRTVIEARVSRLVISGPNPRDSRPFP